MALNGALGVCDALVEGKRGQSCLIMSVIVHSVHNSMVPPPPPCPSPPLVLPREGGVTWSTQIFRCGSLCCCVGDRVVGHCYWYPLYSWQDILLNFAEIELDSTTMFPPGTNVMFIRSTGEPVLAKVLGHSEHGDAYRRITYERDGKTVLHDRASVRCLLLPRAPSRPRPAQSEASSSPRAQQRALVHRRLKRSLQSTLHAFLKPWDVYGGSAVPKGGWGTVTWQPSPRGWWGTVFPGVGQDRGGGGYLATPCCLF